MNCMIDAWLENGEPRLRIVDAESGAVRLDWSGSDAAAPSCDGAPVCTRDHRCPARAALHGLINELFLLACADCVRSGRPVAAGRSASPARAYPVYVSEPAMPAKKITATAA